MILGPLMNILVFALLVGTAALFVRTVGHFPEISSRFVALYGIGTCLDAVLICVFDLMAGHYNCDAVRCHWGNLLPLLFACAHSALACAQVAACGGGSAVCDCVEGDAFKLFVRFNREVRPEPLC